MANYADIVSIARPNSAIPGETVNITVQVKNIWTNYFYASVAGKYGGVDFDPKYQIIAPAEIKDFPGSFIMPDRDIKVYILSYYWTGTEWHKDDEAYFIVKVAELVDWVELASRVTSLKISIIAKWIQLATATIAITPSIIGLWIALAETTIIVGFISHNWIPLVESSINIKALPPIKKEWLPWVAGIGAIGLAAYAITRRD